MTDIGLTSSVLIQSSQENVWKALTTPELIKQWFFGVDTETDWAVGSALVHRGEWQGEPYEDRGQILRFDPPNLLVHTHWSPMSGVPDHSDNYEEITWTLEEREGGTELTITERNLASEAAKAASEQAWKMALANLKSLLE